MKKLTAILLLIACASSAQIRGGGGGGTISGANSLIAASGAVTNVSGWLFVNPQAGQDMALVVSNAAKSYSNIWLGAGTFNASNTVLVPSGTTIRGSGKDSTFWNPCQTNYTFAGTNGVRVSFFPSTNLTLADFTITTGPSNPNGNVSTPVGSYSSTYTNLAASVTTRNMRMYSDYDGMYWRYTKATNWWTDFNSEIYFRWDFAVMGNTANSRLTNYGTFWRNTGVLSNPARCVWMQGGRAEIFNCAFVFEDQIGGILANYAVYFDDISPAGTYANLYNCALTRCTIYGAGVGTSWVNLFGGSISNAVAASDGFGGNPLVVPAEQFAPPVFIQDAITPTATKFIGSSFDGTYVYTNTFGQNINLGNGDFSKLGISGVNQNVSVQTNAGHGFIFKIGGGIITNVTTY